MGRGDVADILVLFSSVTGVTYRLAEAMGEGIDSVEGCTANLRRVPDIEGWEEVYGGKDMAETCAAFAHIPEAQVDDLIIHDGIAVGTQLNYGNHSTALRFFFDRAGKYWMGGDLVGKPGTVFCGGGAGNGREAAMLSLWYMFASFGLTIMPLSMRAKPVTPKDEVFGATNFGAASIASGPGDRPSEAELAAARIQGEAFAELTLKLTS